MLPEKFIERMNDLLNEEAISLIKSLEEGVEYHALRFSCLKGSPEEGRKKLNIEMEAIPWEKSGFIYSGDNSPGKHPYHMSGAYYIQEPSAMAPAAYLKAKPGEKVLDLCAAPGGKSTQIAAAMMGEGLLVSNEINPQRAKILSENIERMGIRNALVLNESPDSLKKHFPGFFDRICVDAPCSGEGMFRKNDNASDEWSVDNVIHCADRQGGILDAADYMLSPGGYMVYSTCTFAPEENEGSISRFIERHPDYEILPVEKCEGMADGIGDAVNNPAQGMTNAIRLFPHRIKGEGHFLCLLRKKGEKVSSSEKTRKDKKIDIKEYRDFERENLNIELKGDFLYFGDQLYLTPEFMPDLKGLKVLRPGLHLGTLKKNRFEPSHALALYLKPDEAKRYSDLPADSGEIRKYLHGDTFNTEKKGWTLICVDGYSIGFGKGDGRVMKNHYPKGLRIQY